MDAIIGAFAGIKIEGELFNKILGIVMVIIVLHMVFKPSDISHKTLERITGKYFWLSSLLFYWLIWWVYSSWSGFYYLINFI